MKIAIGGKGGAGKTTLCALLAETYSETGRRVLAVDTDPSPSLAQALAVPDQVRSALHPIAEMGDLIEDRTGARPGATGSFFTLNPRVDDLPDRFSVVHRGIRLLEMGRVESGGSGCICPESVMLKQLVSHILLRRGEVVLLDMYAGVEHLGRATAQAVDALIAVVEPGARSVATAAQIKSLAADIGLRKIYLVGSKIRTDADRAYIEEHSPGLPVLGHLPYTPEAQAADRDGVAAYLTVPELAAAAQDIAAQLEKLGHQ